MVFDGDADTFIHAGVSFNANSTSGTGRYQNIVRCVDENSGRSITAARNYLFGVRAKQHFHLVRLRCGPHGFTVQTCRIGYRDQSIGIIEIFFASKIALECRLL